jgi:hypothetical protein
MDDQGIAVRFPAQERVFLISKASRLALVSTQPIDGYHGSLLEIKRPGRELDHSSLSAADVKRECGCTFTPLQNLMVDRNSIFTIT